MTNAPIAAKVWAVVVTYRCDLERLSLQFQKLLPQVEGIVWVDNGSGQELEAWRCRWPAERLQTCWLAQNEGLGAAQNVGAKHAIALGATHVLLMDHDSVPGEGMVSALLLALSGQPKAAAAGPAYWDSRRKDGPIPFLSTASGIKRSLSSFDPSVVWSVDHVIASGCLIPVAVWKKIGGMREDFFIDWIDIEWSARARTMGWKILGVCGATMNHRLGSDVIRLLGKDVALHHPWRHYYQVRNLILMVKGIRGQWGMKLYHCSRFLFRQCLFSTLVPGRFAYLSMSLKGLIHGVMGRTGKFLDS